MEIGLYNLEPKIVNTAMMQVSKYYKTKGHSVEIYNPLFYEKYDRIYAFSIFDFTPKIYIRKNMICGGTGFDIIQRLPKEIEDCDFDWALYPECDYSIIWFSKGCIRKCPYCIVWKKDGLIHPVKLPNLNPNGKHIKVMDDNFFANKSWREAIKQLKEWGQPVDFQAIDVRLINQEMCNAINTLKHEKQIGISWDNPRDNLLPKIKEMIKYIKPYKIRCFVFVGYWSNEKEDLYRIENLRKLKIDPFVMPYNKKDRYQRDLARWVNHKAIFKSVKWGDYKQ